MIPILFETTETAFTSNGIGRLTEAISCEVEEERNGVYELTLEYPMTGRLYGEISEGRFIYSRHSDALDAQPFRIYKITKPMNGIITVHAHHRSYDLNHVIVRPFTAGSAAEAMQRISLNTLNACPFTFWTDKSVTADFSLKVPASIRGILGGAEGSILDVYGKGEYEWDNATVKLHLNRGTDTGVTIMYGKNLTDVNEESTAENLVSAVAPFWKDAEGENVVVLPEGILTLAGASSENALPLDLSDKFDEAPTVEDLRSKANTWLTNNGKLEPESNIRLSFAQLWQTEEYKSYALLQRVNLCDTVTVIYPALGVKAKTKVIRVVYDALLERYTKMELGEPKSTLSGTLARQEETVRQIVRSFQYPTISQVNAAVNTATKLITGGMGGHVVIGTNANGQPNEILIMDTDDIDTAVNVIRMNANGIGFSTTGYNGPFNNAWTIDGAFVADFITSGTLDANLIRAGIIMDKAGKNYWNLETGEISIDASAIGEDYVTSSQLEVTKIGIMTSVSQTYVTKGNAVSSVATQYYSSTSPDSPQGGTWQNTVPEWQDGRYIFEKTTTTTADGQSEEKIVCISGATGATGERGPGIYKVTTEPSSYETETGGFTPAYRIALATVKIQSGVSNVFVGDVIEYDVYHYPVGYVDASYVYLGARTSIKGTDGRNGADHNLLMDVYASSLTKVDGPANRYLSDASNSTTTGQFIAESGLPDPNATHFYRISATQANKSRGLCWYEGANPPIISGSTYRMGCYARASSGSPEMILRFSNDSANRKYFTVSNADWQWFEYTAIFEDSGSTASIYKRTYFYCNPQAAGDALDMCGFRLERVTDDVLAIKLTADTAKADAATAQSTADDAAALAQAAKTSADGKITTFYQSSENPPTGTTVGDLWIDTKNNQNTLSRWNGITWVPVDNKDLSTALQNAATAQATADGKIMTFAQNDAPTGTLDTGDLWVDTDDNNRLYRWNGTTWDEVTDKTNLVPNLTPWFDRPLTDVYNSTTNPNGYWFSTTLTSALTQLPDGWAHVDVTNSGTSNALLMRAVGRAVNGIVTGGNYTCLVEFRNVVNAAGINNFYTQQANGAQFWGDGLYDGFSISASLIVDGAKIYKPMKCVTGPTKSGTLNWLMSIASYIKPSQTVSYDFRVSLYEGTYTGPYKPYVDQELRADVDDAQTAANNAQTTADRKKQTFITTPTTPYYVGDIYFVDNKLLVCHTERLTGSYTADDWSEDLGYASSDTVATLEASTKTELDTIRSEASANYTSLSDSLDKIQASFNTQVEQTSEDFSIRINGLLESLTSLANDTSTKFAEYSKYFRFTADGLEIGEESNALTLVLDNDKISFRRNGVEFSYWDGSDNSFHVGDIIVDVNQVARFGSFGLVPLEGGDLAWKWLGGST